jgi:hypothetical protein
MNPERIADPYPQMSLDECSAAVKAAGGNIQSLKLRAVSCQNLDGDECEIEATIQYCMPPSPPQIPFPRCFDRIEKVKGTTSPDDPTKCRVEIDGKTYDVPKNGKIYIPG